jgi:hypothetical protein
LGGRAIRCGVGGIAGHRFLTPGCNHQFEGLLQKLRLETRVGKLPLQRQGWSRAMV